jgi:hypothetical protein
MGRRRFHSESVPYSQNVASTDCITLPQREHNLLLNLQRLRIEKIFDRLEKCRVFSSGGLHDNTFSHKVIRQRFSERFVPFASQLRQDQPIEQYLFSVSVVLRVRLC